MRFAVGKVVVVEWVAGIVVTVGVAAGIVAGVAAAPERQQAPRVGETGFLLASKLSLSQEQNIVGTSKGKMQKRFVGRVEIAQRKRHSEQLPAVTPVAAVLATELAELPAAPESELAERPAAPATEPGLATGVELVAALAVELAGLLAEIVGLPAG